jgi:muramidase (phage lysozyme)
MPQNWWEAFPEISPSPAARPYPLPGPGGIMPGPALGLRPDPLCGAPRLGQASVGGFDPSSLAGAPMLGQFPGSSPDQALPIGSPQPPFAGGQAGPLSDRRLVVQQAAAAIRDGADPRAVRARLNQVGMDNPDFDPSDVFSDLLPGSDAGAGQFTDNDPGVPASLGGPFSGLMPKGGPATMGSSDPHVQAQSAFDDPRGFGPRATGASFALDPLGRLPPRLDPTLAPQKSDGVQKYYQAKVADPTGDRAGALGRAIVDDVRRSFTPNNPPEPNLSPWQRRRRADNEALAANPRIRAFLDAISLAEGNTNYNSLYGIHHQTFSDRSTHPGNVGQNGGGAAGRYQILPGTYYDLNNRIGPYSMSDRDQDLMAIEVMRERGVLPLILSGRPADFDEAVSRLGQHRAWASFPVLRNGAWQRNPSGQRTEDIRNIRARFNQSLQQAPRPNPGISARGSGIISQ